MHHEENLKKFIEREREGDASPLCCLALLLFIRLIGITGVPSWSHYTISQRLECVCVRGVTAREEGKKKMTMSKWECSHCPIQSPEYFSHGSAQDLEKKEDQTHFPVFDLHWEICFSFCCGELPRLHPDTTSVKITDPWSDWMTLQSSSIQNLQDNVIKKYSPFEMKPKLICQVEIQVFSGTYPITVIHHVGSACVSAYTIRPKPLLV